MANLIDEIFDKQAVVDQLTEIQGIINDGMQKIVDSAPKLKTPIDYVTAVQALNEADKKATDVAKMKAKAMTDLDKAYQQADKAMQEAINLQDEEMQKQIKLSSGYKELSKEQKKLIEIERTRQQTIQYSDKLLQEEAKSEAELRLQQQQLIKAHQSLRVTNEDENRLREQIIAKINANKEALKGMTDEVSKQRDNVGNYKSALEGLAAGALPSMGAAMKVVRTELMQLEALMANGTELTAEQKKRYDELNNELAAMADIQGDVAARTKALSDDYLNLNTALEGLKFGANVLGAVQSATAMLGVEDEKLVATIQKLQAVQTFANSVAEIQNSLNKDSALMVGLRVIKEKLLTSVLGAQTKAQIALNAAKLGFIGLAAAAVTGLVIWIAKMASAKAEVVDLTKKLNEQAAGAIAENVAKVDELKDKWNDLGDNLDDKKKFIEDNKDALADMGLAFNDVNEAEEFFQNQTENYVKAITARAKAEAARAMIVEKQKEVIEAELDAERIAAGETSLWEDWQQANLERTFGAEKAKEIMVGAAQEEADATKATIEVLKEKEKAYLDEAKAAEASVDAMKKVSEEAKKAEEEAKKAEEEAKKAEEERKKRAKEYAEQQKKAREERIALSEKELADIDKFIAEQDKAHSTILQNLDAEEVAITEMYDKALDDAIKYYGEDSIQVERITALRIKALDDVDKKRKEYLDKQAKEEADALEAMKKNNLDELNKQYEMLATTIKMKYTTAINEETDAKEKERLESVKQIELIGNEIAQLTERNALLDESSLEYAQNSLKIAELSGQMDSYLAKLDDTAQKEKEMLEMRKEAFSSMKENVTEAFNNITQSQLDNLDQQSKAYDEDYERRKEIIENTITDETEKTAELKKLDKEKSDHDKQIAKERAEIERKQAIFNNAIKSAEAMSKAVASVGELLATSAAGDPYSAIVRYIAAISAGITAVTTISSLIAQLVQIPQFAKGGTAEANKPFIAGEKGREIGFGVYSGKVYDFSKPTLFKANEPISIKNAQETKQIINNNTEYNKDVTLKNTIMVKVIDNARVVKYFKL